METTFYGSNADFTLTGANVNPIRILIAEDHLVTRVGIAAIVNAQPEMTVIAEAANGQQAIALYRKSQPDVALVDLRMPVLTGFDVISASRHEFPDARFIALSAYDGDEDIRRAVTAGVRAYVTKDALESELIAAIRTVHMGQRYFPRSVAAALEAQRPRLDLTARELEVLSFIVPGLTNKQIATALGIAEYTVKNHVRSILDKMQVEDRTQAATAAIQRGIVHLSR
jgi:two-component system, NarL family, response regulator